MHRMILTTLVAGTLVGCGGGGAEPPVSFPNWLLVPEEVEFVEAIGPEEAPRQFQFRATSMSTDVIALRDAIISKLNESRSTEYLYERGDRRSCAIFVGGPNDTLVRLVVGPDMSDLGSGLEGISVSFSHAPDQTQEGLEATIAGRSDPCS